MGCGKQGAFRIKPTWLTVALAALYGVTLPAHAGALPSGGHFVAGSGSIGGNASSLTIHQTTSRGVIDWNGFSIGNGNRVTFNNGNGATLNRVTGGDTSFILGQLSATGSVYLINPQGIVVGANGVVSTGGRFVASTLDVDNGAFMNGGALTFTGPSTRRVVNLGKIGSTNGDVFLISADEIDNFGSINAPNGSAELAAGKTVLLQDASTGRQVFVQTGSGGTIENAGPISAAQVSLQAADGNIFALAGDHTTIRATGTAMRDGHVWLVADSGAVRLGGTIEAQNASGTRGTVDMNGTLLQLGSQGITPLVEAATWNLITPSIRIDDTTAAALNRSLNAGTSINVGTTGADIEVASDLRWKGAASLALKADKSVYVDPNTTIANQGSGNLTLRADATAIDNGGSVINDGTVDWSNSTGIMSAYYDVNGSYTPGTLTRNAGWTASTDSGLVTQMTGYQLVNSVSDLSNIANFSSNYALGRDIAAAGAIMFNLQFADFTGQFDGLGHAIDGAGIYSGFFDEIGAGGVVRNLGLTNVAAAGGCGMPCSVGVMAAENNGLLANVYTTGNLAYQPTGSGPVEPEDSNFGGLVGYNAGTIVRSWSGASVSGSYDVPNGYGSGAIGGLAGVNVGTIAQSYATGAVTGGSAATVGGLVGSNSGSITQSFATGAIKGGINSGAGLIGSGSGGGNTDYWNVQTTDVSNGGGGVPTQNGLTTAQMSDPASFAGWDFGPGGAWSMPTGATHPVLAWQISHP